MSFTELLILAVIGLVVLGPEELPVVARKVAKYVNEIRKVKDEILGPLNDVRSSATSFINETRELMTKDLSELVRLRDQLNQEIAKRQSAPAQTIVADKVNPTESIIEPTIEEAPDPRTLGTPPMESPENTVSRSAEAIETPAPEKPTDGKS